MIEPFYAEDGALYYLLDDLATLLGVHESTLRRRKEEEAVQVVTVKPAGSGGRRAAVPAASAEAQFDRIRTAAAQLPRSDHGDALLHASCRHEQDRLTTELADLHSAHDRTVAAIRSWIEGTRSQLLGMDRLLE